MIRVALKTARFRRFCPATVAFFAGLDSGQQNVRRGLAGGRARVALDALQELVRIVIENRMRCSRKIAAPAI